MIFFHNHTEFNFYLENEDNINYWIEKVIQLEEKKVGDINCIFCNDEYLLAHNKKYINHDTLTDIITFNYCKKNMISGDIMISINRVWENSLIYHELESDTLMKDLTTVEDLSKNAFFYEELNRVMIHGILHLIGYNDKTNEEKEEMTKKENYYLKIVC